MPEQETARQKFIRNNGEYVRMMRVAAVRAEQGDKPDDAERIRRIADFWAMIGKRAEEDEARHA